jgi:hypothetical protein
MGKASDMSCGNILPCVKFFIKPKKSSATAVAAGDKGTHFSLLAKPD